MNHEQTTHNRITDYISSNRNADLPELVRRWIAEGEGAEQDVILSISVANWRERSSLNLAALPYCDSCMTGLTEGAHETSIDLEESATCRRVIVIVPMCRECAEEFVRASEIVEARS